MAVDDGLDLAVALWRDDGGDAAGLEVSQEGVGVIALVTVLSSLDGPCSARVMNRIVMNVTGLALTGYVATTAPVIAAALAAYVSALAMGNDVEWSKLWVPAKSEQRAAVLDLQDRVDHPGPLR